MASHRLLERENGNLIEQLFAADKQIRNVMRSQMVILAAIAAAERLAGHPSNPPTMVKVAS
jgi:hypothetical protein